MTLVDKVAALRDFLRPPADLALIPALAWMCEKMGTSSDGTIPEQVEELLAFTGVTISTAATSSAAAPAAAAREAAPAVLAAVAPSTMGGEITEVQLKALANLTAIPTESLSDRQAAKLQKLQKKAKRKADAEPEAPRTKHSKQDEPKPKQANIDPTADVPVEKAKQVAFKCTDEGRWGANGEWEYPADKQIVCGKCNAEFTFSGMEQSWYAQKSLYAPARCPTCIAAKKDVRAEKQATGKSGEGRCFNCGGAGHRSAECPEPVAEATAAGGRKACYVCGSDAHLSRNCSNAAKKSKSGCFVCGSTAHLSRECPQRPPPVCFNCGSEGHASKACGEPKRVEGSVCLAFAKGQCHNKKCKFVH